MIGRVLTMEAEPQKNGKTINWCTVDVGDANGTGEPQGIVCGAHNFAVGDLVVVVLPGGVLPGGFEISARKTYGHVSAGMICSAKELGLGEDHAGIIVLPADAGEPGDDVFDLLHLRDEVIEFEINPDRAYALSLRGVAREAALAYGVPFHDPAERETPRAERRRATRSSSTTPTAARSSWPARCPGFDPTAPTPTWMARRLLLCRAAPDLARRRRHQLRDVRAGPARSTATTPTSSPARSGSAAPSEGERLTTLDGNDRALSPEDLVVTDDSGIIGLGGVMGGETTEMSDDHHARADRGRALGRGVDVPHRPAPQAHLRGGQAQRARRRPDHLRGRGRPGGRAARRVRRRHGRARRDRGRGAARAAARSRSRSTCPRGSPAWTSPRTPPSPTSRPSAARSTPAPTR